MGVEQRFSKDISKNSFTSRVAEEWNYHISRVVRANTIETFTKSFGKFVNGLVMKGNFMYATVAL